MSDDCWKVEYGENEIWKGTVVACYYLGCVRVDAVGLCYGKVWEVLERRRVGCICEIHSLCTLSAND